MVGRKEGEIIRPMGSWTDGQTKRRMKKWVYGQTDGCVNGLMGKWPDKQMQSLIESATNEKYYLEKKNLPPCNKNIFMGIKTVKTQ